MKRLLRTLILLLIRIVGAPGALRAKKHNLQPGRGITLVSPHGRRSQKTVSTGTRILLIRPDHLGDLVLTTPVLNALKERLPDAQITMMIGPWSREIVARHPTITQILTCSFPGFQRATQRPLDPYILLFQTARQLKQADYDIAINLRPDFWWGAALIYLAGIPRRVGYALQPGQPFLNQTLTFSEPEHATVSNLRLTNTALQTLTDKTLNEPYTPDRYPLYFVPTDEESEEIDKRLASAAISKEMPIVVIHPGTGAAVKLWSAEAWSQCANSITHIQTSPQQIQIILTGSPSERPLLEQIAHGMETMPVLLSELTIGQLAAVLARAVVVAGVDSGPLHLAVAQNTPTVQLFGPTDERIFGPWGAPEQHPIIRASQKCPGCPAIPCGRLDFGPDEVSQHPCVRLLPERQVEQAIISLLKEYSHLHLIESRLKKVSSQTHANTASEEID